MPRAPIFSSERGDLRVHSSSVYNTAHNPHNTIYRQLTHCSVSSVSVGEKQGFRFLFRFGCCLLRWAPHIHRHAFPRKPRRACCRPRRPRYKPRTAVGPAPLLPTQIESAETFQCEPQRKHETVELIRLRRLVVAILVELFCCSVR